MRVASFTPSVLWRERLGERVIANLRRFANCETPGEAARLPLSDEYRLTEAYMLARKMGELAALRVCLDHLDQPGALSTDDNTLPTHAWAKGYLGIITRWVGGEHTGSVDIDLGDAIEELAARGWPEDVNRLGGVAWVGVTHREALRVFLWANVAQAPDA